MFSLFQQRIANTRVGIEFRPDGFAMALYRSARYSSLKNIETYWFPCNSSKRLAVLSQAVELLNLKGCQCDIALALQEYRRFEIDRPEVPEKELGDSAYWAARKFIDEDLDDLQVEYFDYPEVALRGRSPRINIRATKKSLLQSIRQTVRAAKLELSSIQPVDLSFKNLLALSQSSEKLNLFLKLEDKGALLLIAKGLNLYFVREFSFVGDSAQRDNSHLQYLAIEVQRSVDFFEAQTGISTPNKIHLLSLLEAQEQAELSSLLGYTAINVPLQGRLKGLESFAEATTLAHLRAQGAVAALCQAYTVELSQ